MVPSLPFVLINGKTDLPRTGNKNITGELIKKKMWENISVHGCKQNKEYFQCKTQGFNCAVSQSKPLPIDGHTNIKICINVNSSFALTGASSLKKENNAAQVNPALPSLSNT